MWRDTVKWIKRAIRNLRGLKRSSTMSRERFGALLTKLDTVSEAEDYFRSVEAHSGVRAMRQRRVSILRELGWHESADKLQAEIDEAGR